MLQCTDSREEDFEKAFVDVRVYNPSAQSNLHSSL